MGRQRTRPHVRRIEAAFAAQTGLGEHRSTSDPRETRRANASMARGFGPWFWPAIGSSSLADAQVQGVGKLDRQRTTRGRKDHPLEGKFQTDPGRIGGYRQRVVGQPEP